MLEAVLSNLHECLIMDFVADALFDSSKIPCLNVEDNYRYKCMDIEVGKGLKGS